jgi:hypothetical protein
MWDSMSSNYSEALKSEQDLKPDQHGSQSWNQLQAILNLSRYNDGNTINEINLKLKNNTTIADFKLLQNKHTFDWTPYAELKMICNLGQEFYNRWVKGYKEPQQPNYSTVLSASYFHNF